MKKNLVLLVIASALSSCVNNDKRQNDTSGQVTEKLMYVSFELGSLNKRDGLYAAYTNDADSLWSDVEWVKAIENKMEGLSSSYTTILLFNSKENTPNVASKGLSYSSDFDKYMVCGYWLYPTGNSKFCYGGVESDGNFKKCK